MSARDRKAFSGPAIFSYGFRPFFLAATVFAAGVIPIWILVFSGELDLRSTFAPVDWHIHEMLFGYAAAVVAGFLFTAIPNWTGRMPIRGWPLAGLFGLWLLGRFAMSGAFGVSELAVLLLDCAFLGAIVVMIFIEIIAGKNWRNLMVVVPVSALLLSNVLFHVEVQSTGTSDYGRRMSIAVVIFLIMLIGGRVIPSFTRNWLAKSGSELRPVPFNRFDGICLLSGVVAMGAWVVWPEALTTHLMLAAAAVLHLVRLSRWRGSSVWRSPLLLMLHVAYGFLPAGMLGLAVLGQSAGMHLLGIGAIGGMTMAVMMRAAMGHTGRDLVAGQWLSAGFVLVVLAAITRGLFGDVIVLGVSGLWIAAMLWTAGFGIFVMTVGPWLVRAKGAAKRVS
ncbi:MAG: NnrS family protein [Rhodobacteraceae bacterium]|nr:NnrS family protein [Paracoccaceae bacterium]